MRCECGGDTTVINSRPQPGGVMRWRECLKCGARFSTVERRAEEIERMEMAEVDSERARKIVEAFGLLMEAAGGKINL